MFKSDNEDVRICEWRRFGIFTVNIEHIPFHVLLLLWTSICLLGFIFLYSIIFRLNFFKFHPLTGRIFTRWRAHLPRGVSFYIGSPVFIAFKDFSDIFFPIVFIFTLDDLIIFILLRLNFYSSINQKYHLWLPNSHLCLVEILLRIFHTWSKKRWKWQKHIFKEKHQKMPKRHITILYII